jgi:predicted lipoprotein with Yx(FWY)xxD motif
MVAAAGCGSAGQSAKPDPTSASARTAEVSAAAADPVKRRIQEVEAVRVASTAYGPALVDRRGFALYQFTHDRSADSTCYRACAAAWPPYLVDKRQSNAARGAHRRLVGTIRRRDGRLQVTYAGHPLYYYVGDRRPGQVLCQAVAEFGGTWYVVAPSGSAIH